MNAYPVNLPKPTIEGYDLSAGRVVARSPKDSGSYTQRRRFTRVPSAASARWVFTAEQLIAFRQWVDSNDNGAIWADLPILVGEGLTDVKVRLIGDYTAKMLSGDDVWQVEAKLELREMPMMSEAELDAILIDIDLASATIIANDLHQYVHVQRPTIYAWE